MGDCDKLLPRLLLIVMWVVVMAMGLKAHLLTRRVERRLQESERHWPRPGGEG